MFKYKSDLLLHEGDQIICRPSTLVIKGLLTISKSSKHFINNIKTFIFSLTVYKL